MVTNPFQDRAGLASEQVARPALQRVANPAI